MRRTRLLAAALLITALGSACPDEAVAEASEPTAKDKRLLLDLARQTLSWWVTEKTTPQLPAGKLAGALGAKLGCFVTLNTHPDRLRGCIGMFSPDTPLAENVISRAVAAATHDSRFPPVRPEELSQIHVEISVLTEPRPLAYTDAADLLTKLIPNKHGVILKTRKGSSTYLPQVWESLPEKQQFLSRLCLKHGSLPTCWQQGPERTQVELYQAIVFGEDDHGRVVAGSGGATVGPAGAVYSGPPASEALRGKAETLKRGQMLKPGTRLAPGTILVRGADLTD